MNKAQVGFVGLLLTLQASYAQVPTLRLPDRKPRALSGTAFADTISMLPLREREERIYQEISEGNVPDYLRRFVPVDLSEKIGDKVISLRVFVAPDYLAVGSNEDYFLVPMTPFTAQRIADRMNCLLPTPKLVDAIFQSAPLKLVPSPIPPTSAMTTVPVFGEHNKEVLVQRRSVQDRYPLGTLVAGDKKDLVVCKALADNPGRVAIYGWHRPDGKPIQPLFFGHFAYWADYSHGVRMIDSMGEIDGKRISVAHILADPILSRLLSPEGPVTRPKYTFKSFPHPDDPTIHLPIGERLDTFSPVPGVRVVVDEPTTLMRKVRLVVYALPNGNTIEQTFGRRLRPDDDWHYDIQHIGAQTRFLRNGNPDESLVVAYLEASNHSWPSWLKGDKSALTPSIVETIEKRYEGHELKVVLNSHSGGGAFLLAYIKTVERIPARIDRIAFLDSDYNYAKEIHEAKLSEWLRSGNNSLCVIAYDDFSARLQGKPFVSAEGGTWGRSHAMLKDLGGEFPISRINTTDPERYEGLSGRVVFLLKQNPAAQIFHTVQVERNGFIESLLSGTSHDGQGYRYFGPRAYSRWIHE